MSGKLCPEHDVRISKSYCEGRLANKNSVLVGANPHPANTPASVAWIAGHESWESDPATGNAQGRDCCGAGLPFGGGYVPAVVATAAVAKTTRRSRKAA